MFGSAILYDDGRISLAEGVLLLTLAFTLTAILFLAMTFIKRYGKIRKARRKIHFLEIIENTLFSMLFNETPTVEALRIFKQDIADSILFKKLAIKTIVNLHQNYSGLYREKLEDFYFESGLSNYSLHKLKHKSWPEVVEGLRDLTNLNYYPAIRAIEQLTYHPHEFVQKEAFLGLIRLRGLSELLKRKNRQLFLDDWMQSNILFTLKSHQIPAMDDLDFLLTSSNDSMILLGARLIEHYQLSRHLPALHKAMEATRNPKLKIELNDIASQLNTPHQNLS